MSRYKRYIPIAAIILVALGVNLDQFGIDLQALSRGDLAGTITAPAGNTGSSTQISSQSSSGNDARDRRAGEQDYPKWTSTEPNINQWHIFDGEINRRGEPVGFHARPGGQDPAGARLIAIRDRPNPEGVYTASIEILDKDQWKQKFSSFFPDRLSRNEVLQIILHAYANSPDPDAQPFEGPSGLGFAIQGYTSARGGINTAFPVYVASR